MIPLYAGVNGVLLPSEQASLQISDLSIQRGYGVFDFLKTLNYKPVFLEEHLDRFYRSAAGLRLDVVQEKNRLSYSAVGLC